MIKIKNTFIALSAILFAAACSAPQTIKTDTVFDVSAKARYSGVRADHMPQNTALKRYFNFFDANKNDVLENSEPIETAIDKNADGKLTHKEIIKFIKRNNLKPRDIPDNIAVADMLLFLDVLAQSKAKYVAAQEGPQLYHYFDGTPVMATLYHYKNEDFLTKAITYPEGKNIVDIVSEENLTLGDGGDVVKRHFPGRIVKNYYGRHGVRVSSINIGPYAITKQVKSWDDTTGDLQNNRIGAPVVQGHYLPNQNDEQSIKTIFADTKVLDITKHHHQALATIKKIGPNTPKTLITFDTHSDIYLNTKGTLKNIDIGNWLNSYAVKYKADKIYWVFPSEMTKAETIAGLLNGADNGYYSQDDGQRPLYAESFDQQLPDIRQTPFEVILYYDFNADILTVKKPSHKNYHKFTVVICTESSLPDMSGKSVILTIDADYLANEGTDTISLWENKKDAQSVNQDISAMLGTIKARGIRPVALNLTLSTDFVPKETQSQTAAFFKTIKTIAAKPHI